MKKTTETVLSEDIAQPISATVSSEAEKEKIFVYLGPAIGGLIQKGTIYMGKSEDDIPELALAVEKIPAIKKLIIQDINIRTVLAKLNDGSANAVTNAVKEIQQVAAALGTVKK